MKSLREREREKPGASSVGRVRVRLVVDDVVVFSEVRRLNVVRFSIEDSFVGLRVHLEAS